MALSREKLDERRRGIGGSDAAAVCGVSPWRTPLDVYREKIGEAPDVEQNDAMYWGSVLEDVVAREYALRTDSKVRRRNIQLMHPRYPFMQGNVDRTVDHHKIVLECKTAGRLNEEWGEDGTDQIPPVYLAQVTHYMVVLGYRVAHVAVLFLGDRVFRIYTVNLDDDIADMMIDTEAQFWKDVQERHPPDPINLADVRKRWPRDLETEVVASPQAHAAALRLAEIKEQQKELVSQREELEQICMGHMKDARSLIGLQGEVLATWKVQKTRRFDQKSWSQNNPDLVEQYTREGTMRVFRLKKQ